jgi:hypothetical protein
MRCVDDDARDGGANVRGGFLYAAFGVARVARRGAERAGMGNSARLGLCASPRGSRARDAVARMRSCVRVDVWNDFRRNDY